MKHKVFFLLTLIFFGGMYQTMHAALLYQSRIIEALLGTLVTFWQKDYYVTGLITAACVGTRLWCDYKGFRDSRIEVTTKAFQIMIPLYYAYQNWCARKATIADGGDPGMDDEWLSGCYMWAILETALQTLF